MICRRFELFFRRRHLGRRN